uniref:hypothetical protein n=1 Tax=Tetragenococcus halophilus TaxID=51669 RepID=UPI00159624AF|nr:hypothetical protein [Tetragenococcus halophilus]
MTRPINAPFPLKSSQKLSQLFEYLRKEKERAFLSKATARKQTANFEIYGVSLMISCFVLVVHFYIL